MEEIEMLELLPRYYTEHVFHQKSLNGAYFCIILGIHNSSLYLNGIFAVSIIVKLTAWGWTIREINFWCQHKPSIQSTKHYWGQTDCVVAKTCFHVVVFFHKPVTTCRNYKNAGRKFRLPLEHNQRLSTLYKINK